ncbi:unnamed protein product [Sphagnum compactum]
MAEDAMEVAMEVDESQQATKLTAAVKGKGKMCGISQQQFTGGPWLRNTDPPRLQMLLPTQISLTQADRRDSVAAFAAVCSTKH